MDNSQTRDIGSLRELFVDRWLIDALRGSAALQLHRPVPREVALITDRPWEGNMCGYLTVLHDEGRCRMYYKCSECALVDGPDRFNSLKSRIEGISQRMLTQTLRDLERDGFVLRTVYPQVPVKVEYELTEMGKGLSASAWKLVSWADDHHDDIRRARELYDARSTQ